MTYSERIKAVRESLLVTQEELAVKLGVTPITICRWETGKVEPSIKAKKAIRDLCIREGLTIVDKMHRTKEQISRNMKHNKSKDTKPELLLRKELWKRGLRYRKNYKGVCGKPDIVFLKAKIAVFIDGRMWHGYNWERQKNDFKSNREFWISKIEQNIKRDSAVNRTLIEQGWQVIRFWDFEIKENVVACSDQIEQCYNKNTKSGTRNAKI